MKIFLEKLKTKWICPLLILTWFLSLDGLKSITGPLVSDQIEKYYNASALDTLHNAALPTALHPSSNPDANKGDPIMNDSIFTEFQLPLKGFYRHFKEMTETSKSNHFLQIAFSFE